MAEINSGKFSWIQLPAAFGQRTIIRCSTSWCRVWEKQKRKLQWQGKWKRQRQHGLGRAVRLAHFANYAPNSRRPTNNWTPLEERRCRRRRHRHSHSHSGGDLVPAAAPPLWSQPSAVIDAPHVAQSVLHKDQFPARTSGTTVAPGMHGNEDEWEWEQERKREQGTRTDAATMCAFIHKHSFDCSRKTEKERLGKGEGVRMSSVYCYCYCSPRCSSFKNSNCAGTTTAAHQTLQKAQSGGAGSSSRCTRNYGEHAIISQLAQ